MVNTLLTAVTFITLLVWLLQELVGRGQQGQQVARGGIPAPDLGAEPTWSDMIFKIVVALWFACLVAAFLVKDGDFAYALVVVTLLSGIVAGLDRFWFQPRREALVAKPALAGPIAALEPQLANEVKERLSEQRTIAEYSRSFFPVLAVVLVLRSFVVEPFQIPSSSMEPTLEVGDYIVVNKFAYGLRLPVVKTKIVDIGQPQRGDVIVFFPPNDTRYFIKRLVGLPGDRIQYRNKELYINGVKAEQTLLERRPPSQPREHWLAEKLGEREHSIRKILGAYNEQADMVDVTVQPGHYFMMGDNRDNSSDSRFWGQVPEQNIVGKAFAIWMHWESLQWPRFDRVGRVN